MTSTSSAKPNSKPIVVTVNPQRAQGTEIQPIRLQHSVMMPVVRACKLIRRCLDTSGAEI